MIIKLVYYAIRQQT